MAPDNIDKLIFQFTARYAGYVLNRALGQCRPQRQFSPAIRESPALNALAIQSHGADGPLGNAASVVPMQRRGVEVWPVHTVRVSNYRG
ncbi:hypothetical protein SAMN05192568_1005193 [Methylobacterium pseudosasicola]|uniref:Uncharacterized protein n=1 Tax=Methylobacterium pseudosasicola TaxID=582667 RepID=A0A1I4I164_9HYPH|nr:hypothetical protein SAMN05192568_1005193 [Methylobacterium pseudosasicola]